MVCSNCGNEETRQDAKFCHMCGEKLQTTSTEEVSPFVAKALRGVGKAFDAIGSFMQDYADTVEKVQQEAEEGPRKPGNA